MQRERALPSPRTIAQPARWSWGSSSSARLGRTNAPPAVNLPPIAIRRAVTPRISVREPLLAVGSLVIAGDPYEHAQGKEAAEGDSGRTWRLGRVVVEVGDRACEPANRLMGVFYERGRLPSQPRRRQERRGGVVDDGQPFL